MRDEILNTSDTITTDLCHRFIALTVDLLYIMVKDTPFGQAVRRQKSVPRLCHAIRREDYEHLYWEYSSQMSAFDKMR